MSHERAHTHAATGAAPAHDDDPAAPGRRMRTAQLDAPGAPLASGLDGAALPDALRAKFETSLGTDLSAVRVHTGAASTAATAAVGAKAYAVGNDIHLGAGHDPASAADEHLLAHEVAHTVQQRGGAPVRQYKLEVSNPTDGHEHEADRAADAMIAGRPAAVSPGPTQIARDALPILAQPTVPGSVELGAPFQLTTRVTNPAPGKQYSWAWVDLEDRLLKTAPAGQGAAIAMTARTKAVGSASIGAKVSEVGAPELAVESPQAIIDSPPLEAVWGARVVSKGTPPAPSVAFSTDQLVLTAELAHVVDPEKAGVQATITPAGDAGAVSAATLAWSGSKATWTVSGFSPGTASYQLAITAPGMAPLSHVETITVVHDRTAYIRSLRDAKAAVRTNFARADIWAAHTSSNYVTAHKAHEDGLARGKATQKLARDIMFGLCFAMVGGGGGAALTAWLGVGKKITDKVDAAAVTDGVKDLFKYAIRLGPIQMPTLKPGNTNVEPASFYPELHAVLTGEQEALYQMLDQMESAAEDAKEDVFDHDPRTVVVNAMQSGELVGSDPGGAVAVEAYLATLWQLWINQYGYTVEFHGTGGKNGPAGPPYAVQDNTRFGLEDEIRAAAKRCGQDADAWLSSARNAKQAEADKLNASRPPPPGRP